MLEYSAWFWMWPHWYVQMSRQGSILFSMLFGCAGWRALACASDSQVHVRSSGSFWDGLLPGLQWCCGRWWRGCDSARTSVPGSLRHIRMALVESRYKPLTQGSSGLLFFFNLAEGVPQSRVAISQGTSRRCTSRCKNKFCSNTRYDWTGHSIYLVWTLWCIFYK